MASDPTSTSGKQALLWPQLPHAPVSPRLARRLKATTREGIWKRHAWLARPENVLFLDIETTGLSRYYDEITIVGYQIDSHYRVFIAGDDPAHLLATIKQASTLVTFNGTLFDIPFLKKNFDRADSPLKFPEAHIDLRYAVRRVGLSGGQKVIEGQLGLGFRAGIEDLDGGTAVFLWHCYLRGDFGALRRLIRYNQADIQCMCAVLDFVRSKTDSSDFFFSRNNFRMRLFILKDTHAPARHCRNQSGLAENRIPF
jgi:uncharacterized protein YprB with RNaseH-like and TPR domain